MTSLPPILSKSGNCDIKLLYCASCHQLASSHTTIQQFDWLLELHCNKCYKTWGVCIQCFDIRQKRLTEQRYITRHHHTSHTTSSNTSMKRLLDTFSDDQMPTKKQNIRF